jgi:hypothetical protein
VDVIPIRNDAAVVHPLPTEEREIRAVSSHDVHYIIMNSSEIPTSDLSASEIITGLKLSNYSGFTQPSLATTGFTARLV